MKTFKTEKYRTKRHFFDFHTGQTSDSILGLDSKRSIDIKAVNSLLHFGYIPGNSTIFLGVTSLPGGCEIGIDQNRYRVIQTEYLSDHINNNTYSECRESELVKLGGEIFAGIVEKNFDRTKTNIVALSGGMDSRAILAGIMENTSPKNIITYTFGTPGTFDYEIGNKVAERCGTQHYQFDLTRVKITQEKLIETALRTDGNTDLMQPVFLYDIYDFLGKEAVYWSGFTGDGVGGSHYRKKVPGESPELVLNHYMETEHKGFLSKENIGDLKGLFTTAGIYDGLISLEEELFWINHIERYTTNQLFFNNCQYINPFMDDDFVLFMFGIETKYRRNKSLFNKILLMRFHSIFNTETKSELSSKTVNRLLNRLSKQFPLFIKSKNLNYVDYNWFLVEKCKDLVIDSLNDLSERELLKTLKINHHELIQKLERRQPNAYQGINLLISLNAIMKAFCLD